MKLNIGVMCGGVVCGTAALIELRQEASAVILTVTDDGAGFDPAALDGDGGLEGGGFGLPSMTERAELVGGTLEVRSSPGRGTTVTATVPVPS